MVMAISPNVTRQRWHESKSWIPGILPWITVWWDEMALKHQKWSNVLGHWLDWLLNNPLYIKPISIVQTSIGNQSNQQWKKVCLKTISPFLIAFSIGSMIHNGIDWGPKFETIGFFNRPTWWHAWYIDKNNFSTQVPLGYLPHSWDWIGYTKNKPSSIICWLYIYTHNYM